MQNRKNASIDILHMYLFNFDYIDEVKNSLKFVAKIKFLKKIFVISFVLYLIMKKHYSE
jgi:hypothetical protein